MARKSSIRKEYEKQVKRVQDIVKRGIKKGLTFTEEVIPQTPKRVTRKKVEELKELTYRQIWAKGFTIDEDTGEVKYYSPFEAQKQASEKAKKTIKERSYEDPNYEAGIQKTRIRNLASYAFEKGKYDTVEKYKEHLEKIDKRRERRNEQKLKEWEEELKDIRTQVDENRDKVKEYEKEIDDYLDLTDITPFDDFSEPQEPPKVYKTSGDKIYEVDPETGEVTSVADNPEGDTESDTDEGDDLYEAQQIISEIEDIIDSSSNPESAVLLHDLLEQEMSDADDGGVSLARRLKDAKDSIKDRVEAMERAYYYDEVVSNANAIASIITNGNVPDWLRTSIEEAAHQDRPYRRKQRGHRRYTTAKSDE